MAARGIIKLVNRGSQMTIEQRIQLQLGLMLMQIIAKDQTEHELRAKIAELEAEIAKHNGESERAKHDS